MAARPRVQETRWRDANQQAREQHRGGKYHRARAYRPSRAAGVSIYGLRSQTEVCRRGRRGAAGGATVLIACAILLAGCPRRPQPPTLSAVTAEVSRPPIEATLTR